MHHLLIGQFLPLDYVQTLFAIVVKERNKLHETKAQIVGQFLDGLCPEIEDQVGLQLVHTLQNAIRLAKKVEMQLEKRKA